MYPYEWVDKFIRERHNSNAFTDKMDYATRSHILAICRFLDHHLGLEEPDNKLITSEPMPGKVNPAKSQSKKDAEGGT